VPSKIVLVGYMVYRFKMLRNSRIIYALLGALLVCSSLTAQNSQSGYTIIGIGDVNLGALAQNSAMGGVGLSYNSKYFVNTMNPALFGMNENAVFHIGGSVDFRNYSNEVSSFNSTTGGFKDFVVSLPIKFQKWNMGIGLIPYSVVNFAYSTITAGPDGTTQRTELSGIGGIDEVFITNGFKLNDLYLGVKAGFLFGSIQKVTNSYLEGGVNTAFGNTVITSRQSFSDLYFQLGAAYKLKMSETSFMNFGATFSNKSNISGNTLVLFDQQSAGGDLFSRDTLSQMPNSVNDKKPFMTLPSRIGFGFSYERYQRFNIGLDFITQNWNDYRDFEQDPLANYGQSYRVAVGGEILPNSENTGFFGLISYRFGLFYEQTPYVIRDEAVNDIGITFGTSVPLSAYWGLSSLNLGVTYGQRGSVGNGLIREDYIKIDFGFSIQDVTWFTRTKYN